MCRGATHCAHSNNKISQVQFPYARAILACLGEACRIALCVYPLRLSGTSPEYNEFQPYLQEAPTGRWGLC